MDISTKVIEFLVSDEEKGIRFRHNPINNNLNLDEVNYLATDHFKSL